MRRFHLKRRDLSASKSPLPDRDCSTHNDSVGTMTTSAATAALINHPIKSLLMAPDDFAEGCSMIAPEMLPDLVQSYSQSTDGGAGSRNVPEEVTAFVQEPRSKSSHPQPRDKTTFPQLEEEEEQGIQPEKYTQTLEVAQQQVQRLTFELRKSQSHAVELLKHNKRLMAEVKGAIVKEDISEEYRMLKQELMIVKASVFCGVVYVLGGGRPDIISVLALVWLLVDFSS